MGLADLHALVPVLAASGEKSKTAFFISGGLLAAWAVVVSVIGLRQPDFPRNVTGSRAVMGLSALLVVATTVTAVLTAQPPPKENEASASAPAAPPPGGAPAAVTVAADPSGQLKYQQTSLAASAGAVKINFTNDSPVAHNVTIEQNGKAVSATQTVTQAKASVVAQLKVGTYTFYCSVDAHRQAGMVGTLKVS